ncbi:MAG TPA: hypothetical protein VF843_01950 [Streptosporangiaceae bacterium]
MSGSTPMATSSNNGQRWADLDQQNERLVDSSHPLLADLRRDYPAAGVAPAATAIA